MRALLSLGCLVAAAGMALLVWGVREQVAWTDCGHRCPEPVAWPVTVGILVLIAGGFLSAWALAAGYASRALHPDRDQRDEIDRLLRVGLVGSARAEEFDEAGVSATGEPVLDVDLTVFVRGRPPYRLRRRLAVPRRMVGRLRRGRSVPVLVDPDDGGRLTVGWSLRPSALLAALRPSALLGALRPSALLAALRPGGRPGPGTRPEGEDREER